MTELGLAHARGWPEGVYLFGGDVLRVDVIAAAKLPRDRSTLLVRLMAAGRLLPDAVEDLRRLPAGARERVVADQILLALQHTLERKPEQTPLEQEFIVKMYSTWEDARALGLEQGRTQGHAEALLTVLRQRRIPVPAAARKRILAEKNPDRLGRWLERAVVAESLAQVLGRAAPK